MSCPHGAGSPDGCSQCAGAVPRKVEQVGAVVTIDGVVVRETSMPEHADPGAMTRAQRRRGGRR